MASYIRQLLVATSTAVTLGTSFAQSAGPVPESKITTVTLPGADPAAAVAAESGPKRTLRYTEQCNQLKSSPTIQVFDKAKKPEAFAQDDRVGCRFGLNGQFKNLLEVYPLQVPARAEDFQLDMSKARTANNAAGGDKKAAQSPTSEPAPDARQAIVDAHMAKRAERQLERERRRQEKYGTSP